MKTAKRSLLVDPCNELAATHGPPAPFSGCSVQNALDVRIVPPATRKSVDT
jgi:hypothetical protein